MPLARNDLGAVAFALICWGCRDLAEMAPAAAAAGPERELTPQSAALAL